MTAPAHDARPPRAHAIAVVALVAACAVPGEPAAPPAPVATWPCPDGWAPYARGGCAPAAIVCDPQRGPCTNTHAWHEPGEPDGPPVADWVPVAGEGAPDAAWSPVVGAAQCAPGWRRDAEACDPALRTDCPDGAAALPGGLCEPIAVLPCDTDAFPDADPAIVRVVRVRAGADAATADGTSERPYATIAAALSHLGDDGQVLVAPGDYRESVEVTARARIVGRCGVTITGVEGRPTVRARGRDASLELRGVSIVGGATGVSAEAGARVTVRGVSIAGVVGIGVDAEDSGTVVTVASLRVRGTTSRRDASGRLTDGDALVARAGARMTASRVLAEDNRECGVYVADGATITLEDSVVRGTQPRPDGQFGHGLLAETGGALTVSRSVVESSYATGAQANGARASLRIEDSVVRGTRALADGMRGWGLVAGAGARVEGARVLLADNRGAGAYALGAGASLALSASVVRGTAADRDGDGYGVLARDGASLVAESTVIERSVGIGACARARGTLTLDGVVVRETAVGATPLLQSGAAVDPVLRAIDVAAVGAEVHAANVRLDGDVSAGVFVVGRPVAAHVTLRDAAVVNAHTDGGGMALVVGPGATLEASRVLVVNSRGASANATGEGATVVLEDSVVRGAQRSREGTIPGALQALAHGSLTARRVRIEDSAWCGALAADTGSHLTLEDAVVRRSGVSPQATAIDAPAVAALMAFGGASLTARRVLVDGATGAAVDALQSGSTIDVEGSVLRAGAGGFGIRVEDGAAVEARRVLLAGNGPAGALSMGADTSLRLQDSIVRDSLAAPGGDQGFGLVAEDGAALTVERTLVDGNRDIGVLGARGGSHVTLTDCAVRGTQPRVTGFGGAGVFVGAASRLDATRVRLSDNGTAGVISVSSDAALDDVTVSATRPVDGAYGVGVLAIGAGAFDAHRLAIVDVRGVAFAAVPVHTMPPAPPVVGAPTVTLTDLFVRGVRAAAVSLIPTGDMTAPRRVAYGLHCGPGGSLSVTGAVIDDGDIGYFVAQGALSLRRTLIARQLDTAGAVTAATPRGAVQTDAVRFSDNLRDDTRTDDSLPVVDALTEPTAPCPRGGCP